MAKQLEDLSLEELKAMRAELDEPNLEDLSLDELKRMRAELDQEEEEPLIPRSVLQVASDVGEFVDSYAGSPLRAGVGRLQDDGGDVLGAIGSAWDQFGEDPSKAPTSKDITGRMGFSRDETIELPDFVNTASRKLFGAEIGKVSPAGIAGLGFDLVADPLNFIPAGAIAGAAGKTLTKGLGTGLKYGSKATSRIVGKGVDLATGTRGGTNAAKLLEKGVEAAGDSLKTSFTAKVSDDLPRYMEIAERNGINIRDIDAVEFGKDSMPAQAFQKKAEGPFGEKLRTRYNDTYRQINRAIENTVETSSKERRFVEPYDVGKSIHEDFKAWQDKIFSQIDFTYDSIWQMNPKLNIIDVAPEAWDAFTSKLNGLEKIAKGRVERAMSAGERAQAKDLIKAIEIAKRPNGNFKQAVEQLQSTGRSAFKPIKPGATVPPDIDSLRDIYFAMSDMLVDTTEKTMGAEVANALKANNNTIKKYMTDRSQIGKVLGSRDPAPEDIFTKLVQNANSRTLKTVTEFSSPETMKKMKKGFFYSMVDETPDDLFSIKRFYRKFADKKNKHKLKLLFAPEEVKNIFDLIELGDAMGDKIFSHSRTSAANTWQNLSGAFKDAATNDAIVDAVKNSARGTPFSPNVALPPIGEELFNLPLGKGRQLPIKRPPILGGEVSTPYKVMKPLETYYQMQNTQEQGMDVGRVPQSIPAKNLNRNILPSNVLMGSKGKMIKQAMGMISGAPVDMIMQAQPMPGSANIFDGIHQVMQNQDVNHLINSTAVYNSKYGPEITKDIFAGVAGIDGVITVEKLFRRLDGIPQEARQEVINQFQESFMQNETGTPVVIPEGERLGIIQDVKSSVMNSKDKAKIIRNIMDRGVLDAETYKKIIFPVETEQSRKVADDWKRRVLEQ